MKKYLIVFVLPFFIWGCSFLPTKKAKNTNPEVSEISQEMSVGSFYFTADSSGLTLLSTDNEDFSLKLSENLIGEANIVDGILTFTEILETGENIRAVNLKSYVKSFKSNQ